jgi:hypothetical protein
LYQQQEMMPMQQMNNQQYYHRAHYDVTGEVSDYDRKMQAIPNYKSPVAQNNNNEDSVDDFDDDGRRKTIWMISKDTKY